MLSKSLGSPMKRNLLGFVMRYGTNKEKNTELGEGLSWDDWQRRAMAYERRRYVLFPRVRGHLANDPKKFRGWALFYERWYTGIVCWMSGTKEQDCIPRHHTYEQRLQSIIIGRMIWNGNALAVVGWNTLTGSMVKWSWAVQARQRVNRCVTNMCYGWHRLTIVWLYYNGNIPCRGLPCGGTWRLGTSWKPGWTAEQDSKPTVPNNDRGFTENKINSPIRQAWNINTAAILGLLAIYETKHAITFHTKSCYWLQHRSNCSYVTSYVTFIRAVGLESVTWDSSRLESVILTWDLTRDLSFWTWDSTCDLEIGTWTWLETCSQRFGSQVRVASRKENQVTI